MSANDAEQALIKYLADAHSVEEQALVQLRRAPNIAGDPELARTFREHIGETEEHERLVRRRLEELGAGPSKLKDLAGKASGLGMVVFAQVRPDTPGLLTMHASSYEAMEQATYELLGRIARRLGDEQTAEMAGRICRDEHAMRERLHANFDRAIDATLSEKGSRDLEHEIRSFLQNVHAIEHQALTMLNAGPKLAGDEELGWIFREHHSETERHAEQVRERLEQLGGSRSIVKDLGQKLGALNIGGFFGGQPDTPAKLTGFAFAFEHLEIAAYELLIRLAQRAGDQQTVAVAEGILANERATADRVSAAFDRAAEAALEEQGVAA